jgi:hypothetical protein
MADTKPIISVDEFSTLDADEQALYKKRGDSEYILDVNGIKSALQHERQNFTKFKEEVEPLFAFKGLDANKVKSLLDREQKKAEKDQLEKQGYEETLRQKETAFQEALKQKDTEWSEKHNKVLGGLKNQTLKNYLTENGVLPDRANYALNDIAAMVEIDVTDDGVNLKKKNGIGGADELTALVNGLKEKSPFLFASNAASGGGASGSQGNNGSSTTTWTRSQWDAASTEERTKFSEAKGQITG